MISFTSSKFEHTLWYWKMHFPPLGRDDARVRRLEGLWRVVVALASVPCLALRCSRVLERIHVKVRPFLEHRRELVGPRRDRRRLRCSTPVPACGCHGG